MNQQRIYTGSGCVSVLYTTSQSSSVGRRKRKCVRYIYPCRVSLSLSTARKHRLHISGGCLLLPFTHIQQPELYNIVSAYIYMCIRQWRTADKRTHTRSLFEKARTHCAVKRFASYYVERGTSFGETGKMRATYTSMDD